MKIVLAFLFAMTFLSTAHAGGWTDDLTLVHVTTEPTSDLVYFTTSDGSVYTSGCVQNAWQIPAETEERRSRAYAALMAALVSGKKIRLWYLDSCGTWSYHIASAVRVMSW